MSEEWEALRLILKFRRGIMQRKVDEDESATVHKCAVLTLDYVLEEMDRLEAEAKVKA